MTKLSFSIKSNCKGIASKHLLLEDLPEFNAPLRTAGKIYRNFYIFLLSRKCK